MELNRRNTFRGTINRIRDYTNDAVVFEATTIVGLRERLDSLKSAFEKLTTEHLSLVEAAADQAAVDAHDDFFAAAEEICMETAIKIRGRMAHLKDFMRANHANSRVRQIHRQTNCANKIANATNDNNNQQILQVAAATEIPLDRLSLSTSGGVREIRSLESKQSSEILCHSCGNLHSTFQCVQLNKISLSDRRLCISKFKLCWIGSLGWIQCMQIGKCPIRNGQQSNELCDKHCRDSGNETPALTEVLAFLERQARGNMDFGRGANGTHHQQQNNCGAKPKHMKLNGNGKQTQQSEDSSSIVCHLCKNPHPTYRCAQLNQMNSKVRRTQVSEMKLCFVCLSPGHRASANVCKLGNCPICNGSHNRILCDKTAPINSAPINSALVPSFPEFQPQQQQQQQYNSSVKPKQFNSYGDDSKQPAESSGIFCFSCGNPHSTFRCEQLNRMSINDRRSRASELKLCLVCLLPEHWAGSNNCELGNCSICGGRHSRILCDRIHSIDSATIQPFQPSQLQMSASASSNEIVPGAVQYI